MMKNKSLLNNWGFRMVVISLPLSVIINIMHIAFGGENQAIIIFMLTFLSVEKLCESEK